MATTTMTSNLDPTNAYAARRLEMVERVRKHFAETEDETGVEGMSQPLESALGQVPRHCFVSPEEARFAYADSALPIGHGQTISQPFIVALMIELAGVTHESRVLEVGTGSGYEAAVLASIGAEVYSIELIPELAREAGASLTAQGFGAVHLRCGDGFEGWEEMAPFDAILVTACSGEVPEPLLRQLAPGGRMVIPIGSPRGYQELRVIERMGTDSFVEKHGLPVAFVPLVHDAEGPPIDSEG